MNCQDNFDTLKLEKFILIQMFDTAIGVAGKFLENPVIKANASLSFSVATGSTITTDSVGNPIISPTAMESVVIACWLQQAKPPVAEVQEGSYLDCEYFEGRLVKPRDYPFPIRTTGELQVTINGRIGLVRQLNVFESPTSQQLGIAAKLGRKIKLYARFEQGS
uniref:Uncharacterized protein n=1 Tax=Bacteriophage sp. TaxID=38018 RepID=A0A7G9A4E4_9VIRU|nr:MAG: hypothetical protein [Bacteriophage sp.]